MRLAMLKLKKIITCVLITACLVCSVGVASACNEGKDYSEDLAKLQQQIDNLKTENDSLKNQISNLTPDDVDYAELIDELQQQIDALKNQNGDYAVEIDKLQKDIILLQQAASNELKTYKVGETFTFNYCNTYVFSITLETRTKLVITNIKSPVPLQICDFIQIQQVGLLEGMQTSSIIELDNKSLKPNETYEKDLKWQIGEYHNALYFGYPLSNENVLPYAVFDIAVTA